MGYAQHLAKRRGRIPRWAIAHGIFEIIGAIQLRKDIDNECRGADAEHVERRLCRLESPDRLDALVWALSELMLEPQHTFKVMPLRL
jgi:hypothetical protein